MAEICSCCINAVEDEASGSLDSETAGIIAREIGKELADHLCEAVEDPGTECGCGCREGSPASFGMPPRPGR